LNNIPINSISPESYPLLEVFMSMT